MAAIVQALGLHKSTVLRDIRTMREEGDLPYRCVPSTTYLSESVIAEVERLWKAHKTAAQIGAELGWDTTKAERVVKTLRREGYCQERKGQPIYIPRGEHGRVRNKATLKRALNEELRAMRLTDNQRVILRILKAAERPLAVAEIVVFLRSAKNSRSVDQVRFCLNWMQNRSLVAKATVSAKERKWFERRNRWFVAGGRELSAEKLTLRDAEREAELSTLIESQGEDLRVESGHWLDHSLDAPLTESGDFTILDTLGKEDEDLATLMEEVG